MVTIVLTYRNRDTSILKKCLDAFKSQTDTNFKVVLVNYGSHAKYTKLLHELSAGYKFLQVIDCKTQRELWSKSRAVNIVLRQTDTSHFFVGDVDMIYHPEFIETVLRLKNEFTTYFQVGFLSEEESQKEMAFEDYDINFKSDEDATGMTLFKTETLKSIGGFDEFYHGWGSEDTDVHRRLIHHGETINYYDDNILMLHQWHPKHYRTKASLEPFHSQLELINEAHLNFSSQIRAVHANTNTNWGHYADADYKALETINSEFLISNSASEFKGFMHAVLLKVKNNVVRLTISEHQEYKSLKQLVKGKIGKKTMLFIDMDTINDTLLECIITNLRGQAYRYEFNRKTQIINLIIKL